MVDLVIKIADVKDVSYAKEISELYVQSAKDRGTGIATRTPEYIAQRIERGNSIIALTEEGVLAGYCYIEVFSHEEYVSNSGLIVKPRFRGYGLSKKIKKEAVQLAWTKYPKAKLFGITTSDIVMKINSELGYIPVSYRKLTDDDEFWNGCKSCQNYDILMRNDKSMCLCTAMLAPSGEEALKFELPVVNIKKDE